MSTQPNPNQQLEVLERNEVYEDSDEGLKASISQVPSLCIRWRGICTTRCWKPENFENIIQIPSSAYNPKFSTEFTPAPQTLPNNYFVKKPQLISYDRISQGPRPDSIAEDLKEARI